MTAMPMTSRAVRAFLRLALGAALLAGAGCAHRPPPLKTTDVPPGWGVPTATEAALWPAPDWWSGFQSKELDSLIASAEAANLDLAAAAARVLQAEAQARIAGSSLLPQVDLEASASQRGPLVPHDADARAKTQSFELTAGAAYELDFWGKNRANLKAAKASLRASRYDQETVALTVTSGVATTYFQVLSLRERLSIARLNLADALRLLALVQARVRSGVVSPLDLAQEEFDGGASARRHPRARATGARGARRACDPARPAAPRLRRDGRELDRAQRAARGAGAHVGAARAQARHRPRRSPACRGRCRCRGRARGLLSEHRSHGRGGLCKRGARRAGQRRERVLRLAASLAEPIFDAGRLAAEHKAAVARRTELIADYRASVIGAFSDVETALGSIESLAAQESASRAALAAARRAFNLSEIRYRAGVDTLLTALDAQRTLYQSEDDLAQTRFARLSALVGLYRALGGGWQDTGAVTRGAPANAQGGSVLPLSRPPTFSGPLTVHVQLST